MTGEITWGAKPAPDLSAALQRAAEALEPFAHEAVRYEPDEGDSDLRIWDCDLTLGHLRRARAVLATIKQKMEVE